AAAYPEAHSEPLALDLPTVRREWSRILEEFRGIGLGIGIALSGGRPMGVSGSIVTIGFGGTGSRHALERPMVKSKVEESLARVFGHRVSVKFQYGVKLSGLGDGGPQPGRDPVVEAAVKEYGFRVTKIEGGSD
ncbi:MAG TPA: hypothetical protein VHS28_06615, partial [Chloroflexota bacterium]|nr:hypothetical protein [Chloroflexota bacterium]